MITLDQAKAHLRVAIDGEDAVISANDALISEKLAAAKEFVADYTASDPDSDTAPAPVREAVLQLTAHLYWNREASLVGVTAQQLPFGFLDLLVNYRAWAF